jgi:hypothetical protein
MMESHDIGGPILTRGPSLPTPPTLLPDACVCANLAPPHTHTLPNVTSDLLFYCFLLIAWHSLIVRSVSTHCMDYRTLSRAACKQPSKPTRREGGHKTIAHTLLSDATGSKHPTTTRPKALPFT